MCYTKKLQLIFSALIFMAALNFSGQTFSIRSDNNITSAFFHVINLTDGYLSVGRGFDSINSQLFQPTFLKKYNFNGDLIADVPIFDNNVLWNFNLDCNFASNDDKILVGGFQVSNLNDSVYDILLTMNNSLELIDTFLFLSPYFNVEESISSYTFPSALSSDPTGVNTYMVSQVVDYPPIQNNFIIRKINSQGEVVWTYINPINPNYYACSAMIYQGSSLWALVAGWGLNSYNKVVQINTETGEFVNEIVLQSNPNNLAFAEELFKDAEGFVIASRSFNSDNYTIPALYKMDYNGNLLWTAQASGTYSVSQNNDHLVQSNDGGFVSCGEKYDEEPSWLYPNDPAMNNTMKRIWLWKVDANGNFLWQRFYSYYDFDYSSEYFHLTNIAHDMKATPDGGFIMAGEASAACTDYPDCDNFTQQGWLLKVDACGCLVPGCDPNCIVSVEEKEETEEQTYFRFGPNPVGDLLNLYIPSLPFSIKEVTFSLIDMNGRTIKDFQFQYDNTTYMIDTYSLTAGNYILSLTKDGQVLQREKVVKE